MAQLFLTFLGGFQAMLAGQALRTFESDKVRALLAYLTVEASTIHSRLWDLRTARTPGLETAGPLHILHGHTHWLRAVAFSPDGKILATAGAYRTVRCGKLAAANQSLCCKAIFTLSGR